MLNQNILIQAVSQELKVLYRLLNPFGIELSIFFISFHKRGQWYKRISKARAKIVKETETGLKKEWTCDKVPEAIMPSPQALIFLMSDFLLRKELEKCQQVSQSRQEL